jgi:hypothetical protein
MRRGGKENGSRAMLWRPRPPRLVKAPPALSPTDLLIPFTAMFVLIFSDASADEDLADFRCVIRLAFASCAYAGCDLHCLSLPLYFCNSLGHSTSP